MSETHDDIQRAFDALWSGSESRSWVKGRLGKVDTDGTIVIKTGRPGFVHVRLGQEGQDGVAIARNLGVPLKPYLPVRMRLEPNKGYLVIHGVDYGGSADTFDGQGGLSHTVGPHTHALRSGLEYPIEALRLNPGRVQCDSGLTCSVNAFRYYHADAFDTWTGGDIDVTSYLPASTKWCWILIGVDPATNTLVAAKGADQDAQADLTAELIDAVTFPYIPCGAAQATSTDTSLSNIDRWTDARTWLNKHAQSIDDIPDVVITTPADGHVLYFDNPSSKWINGPGTTATVDIKKSLDVYTDVKERLSEENIHGGFAPLATAQPLDSVPTDINVTAGIGKIVVVVNVGSDIAGDIVITGTSVDRDTGAETADDTSTLTVDALTTDTSDTDSNGNIRHNFTGAYISDRWFKGAIVISTADLTLTDVDVYQVAFEQFGDTSDITLDTLDFSGLATNASAWCNVHLYSLEVTGDKCVITEEAEAFIDAADVSANKWYRLRIGEIDKALDGATDGIWVDQFLGPLANVYWEDINCKVWYTEDATIIGHFTAPWTDVDYIQFDITYADGVEEGRLQWNIEDGTLEVGMPGGNVNLQLGQEMVIRCRNETGAQIDNGSVVEIIGASGNKPLIALADASDLTKISVIGMATEDIAHNDNGYVNTRGFVRDVNTNGMTLGEPVWLSASTPGAYTQTRPTAPDFSFAIGIVIAAHTSEGVIYNGPIPSWRMMDSSDVLFDATPADGEYLAYNLSNGRFELTAAPSGGVSSHGALTDLLVDDHTQYALLLGRSGGQTLIGGTDASDDLTLESTSNATKGHLILQPSDGNVGIGTAAPGLKLTVVNDGVGSSSAIRIETNTTANRNILDLGVSDSSYAEIRTAKGGSNPAIPLVFSPAGTEQMRIMVGGNVGIGTAAPDGTLHVHTATAGAVTAAVSADDLVVENSGNAGISILTPAGSIGSIFFGDVNDNDEGGIQFDHFSNNLVIFTGSGNLNVLTTGPYTNNDSFRIASSQSPASGGAGMTGEVAWDGSYIYVCISSNTWARAALVGGY